MTVLQPLRLGACSAVVPAHHKGRATLPEGPERPPAGSRAAPAGGRRRRLPLCHIVRSMPPARRTRHAVRRIILL